MSNQPTLTRLFAALAFAGIAVYVATIYQMLKESAQVFPVVTAVAAVIAALSGWAVAGPRINARLVGSVFATIQGLIVAIVLALAAGATIETFRLGYKTRYKDLGGAMQGFFSYIADGVRDLAVPDLLVPIGVFGVVGGIVLSVLYRMLEARRTAR